MYEVCLKYVSGFVLVMSPCFSALEEIEKSSRASSNKTAQFSLMIQEKVHSEHQNLAMGSY